MKINEQISIFIALLLIAFSCTRKPELAVLTTAEISGITDTGAVSGGTITYNGGASVYEKGVCWNTTGNPTINDNRSVDGSETSNFSSIISGLSPNTLYYVRAYATNKAGTAYGNQLFFTTTLVIPPSLTTNEVKSITSKGAVSGGYITSNGGGAITGKGGCWATTENPAISDFKTSDGTAPGSFNSYLTGLSPSTKYYVRAYATNSAGTSYGDQLSFTTASFTENPAILNPDLAYDSVTDIEGNIYRTIQIGTRIWMAENLRTTQYNEGTGIVNIIDDESWFSSDDGAYCWYNNDISNKDVYGALYNWFAVSTGNLCPSGWRIPAQSEWVSMINSIGELSVAGAGMKESGTFHWNYPNQDATNESGFTALPGGLRYVDGIFMNMGISGRWWTSTDNVGVIEITYNSSSVNTNASCAWRRGISVRCVKD